jgi:WD40 repeat protein
MARHLIISVHGILTASSWQPLLRAAILETEPDAVVHDFDYKTVSPHILARPRRGSLAKHFGEVILAEMTRESWGRIDIVAHSFGTYLVAQGLRYLARNMEASNLPKIRTVILCGSVLKISFPLREIVPSFVERVVNECGMKDNVLWMTELLFPGLGFAGRVGFSGLCGHDVFNRYFLHRHSGCIRDSRERYISSEFMRRWWLPLLTQDRPRVEEHDDRPRRKYQVAASWLERQASLMRIGIAIALIYITGYAVHDHHERELLALRQHNRELTAQKWTLDALQERDTSPIDAARFAIAAASIEHSARTDEALLNVLQTSARPTGQIQAWNLGSGFLVAVDPLGEISAEVGTDNHNDAIVHLKSLPTARERRDMEIDMSGCLPRRQPQHVRFSPGGRHLVLETYFGSCVLDVRSGTWQSSMKSYGQIMFTADERNWYALRVPLPENPKERDAASAIFGSEKGIVEVSGIVGAGWIKSASRLGSDGAALVDSIGRLWIASRDGAARQFLLPALDGERVADVATNADGGLVAIGTESGRLLLVDLTNQALMWQIQLKAETAKIVFSRADGRIAAMLSDGSAIILSSDKGVLLGAFDGKGPPLDLSFLDDAGDRLLTINRDANPKVWDVSSHALLDQVPIPVFDDRYAFDASGRAVVAAAADGTTTVWDMAWRSEARPMNLEEGIDAIATGGLGRYVAALGRHGRVRMWDVSSRQLLVDVPSDRNRDSEWRSSMAISESGNVVAVLDDSGTLHAWRPERGEVFRLLLPRSFAENVDSGAHEVIRLLPSQTDQRILSYCGGPVEASHGDGAAKPDSIKMLRACATYGTRELPEGLVSADLWNMRPPLAVSPDGRYLAVSVIGDVFVFDIDSGVVVHHWPLRYEAGDKGLLQDRPALGPPLLGWLAFSQDGKSLQANTKRSEWTGARGNTLTSWRLDGAAGSPVQSVQQLDSTAQFLGPLGGTGLLASVPEAGHEIDLHHDSTLTPGLPLQIHGTVDAVLGSYWHPNSLVVVSHNNPKPTQPPVAQIDVYDRKTLTFVRRLNLPKAAVWVSLMPDERRLMVLGAQQDVRIIDLKSGTETSEFTLAVSPKAVWFGPGGTFFYTTGTQREYVDSMAEDGNIFALSPSTAEDLSKLLCQTLRPSDKDFTALSKQVDRPISCKS